MRYAGFATRRRAGPRWPNNPRLRGFDGQSQTLPHVFLIRYARAIPPSGNCLDPGASAQRVVRRHPDLGNTATTISRIIAPGRQKRAGGPGLFACGSAALADRPAIPTAESGSHSVISTMPHGDTARSNPGDGITWR